jgi:hypothetical protein
MVVGGGRRNDVKIEEVFEIKVCLCVHLPVRESRASGHTGYGTSGMAYALITEVMEKATVESAFSSSLATLALS